MYYVFRQFMVISYNSLTVIIINKIYIIITLISEVNPSSLKTKPFYFSSRLEEGFFVDIYDFSFDSFCY